MIYMYQWEGVTVCNQTLRWQRQRPNQYHCFWKAVFEETFIFLQNPTPTPSPCGWEYMRIFFLQNCSALVWNYKFGLRETFWPSLTKRRILNAKIAQGDAADGQFLPFQIAQLVWNYKFGLGEKHSTHHSPPLFHSAAQLGILIACQSSTATLPSSSS